MGPLSLVQVSLVFLGCFDDGLLPRDVENGGKGQVEVDKIVVEMPGPVASLVPVASTSERQGGCIRYQNVTTSR